MSSCEGPLYQPLFACRRPISAISNRSRCSKSSKLNLQKLLTTFASCRAWTQKFPYKWASWLPYSFLDWFFFSSNCPSRSNPAAEARRTRRTLVETPYRLRQLEERPIPAPRPRPIDCATPISNQIRGYPDFVNLPNGDPSSLQACGLAAGQDSSVRRCNAWRLCLNSCILQSPRCFLPQRTKIIATVHEKIAGDRRRGRHHDVSWK